MMLKIALILSLASAAAAFGGPFQNLGFELANISNTTPSDHAIGRSGFTQDLLPGWSLFLGDTQQFTMRLNETIGKPSGQVVGQAVLMEWGAYPNPAPEGLYSLWFRWSSVNSETFTITQRGDVPSDANYFLIENFGPVGVFLDGQALPMIAKGIYDMRAFAGKTDVDLRIVASNTIGSANSEWTMGYDAIRMTPAIPEPGSLLLMSLGGLATLWLFRKSR